LYIDISIEKTTGRTPPQLANYPEPEEYDPRKHSLKRFSPDNTPKQKSEQSSIISLDEISTHLVLFEKILIKSLAENQTLYNNITATQQERDFYYNKLRSIEVQIYPKELIALESL
jgi:hypothetical protein